MKKIINNTTGKNKANTRSVQKETITGNRESSQFGKAARSGEGSISKRPVSRTSDNNKVK